MPAPPNNLQDAYLRKLRAIAAQQLASTLKYLEPANALPLWSVTIETKANVDAARSAGSLPSAVNARNYRMETPQGESAAGR